MRQLATPWWLSEGYDNFSLFFIRQCLWFNFTKKIFKGSIVKHFTFESEVIVDTVVELEEDATLMYFQ